ncbi:MAG: thiosulfate oxidation carrier protein SoxY [Rhizobiaceae bacterium]
MNMNRRDALALGAGAAAFALTGLAGGQAFASAEDVDKKLMEIAGGSMPEMGKVMLATPEIAENGNTVPVSVSVESAMAGGDMVESITLYADGNPNPEVVTFHFTALSGAAQANTRMRLAKTQNVVAVAKMADGSTYMDKKQVKVTIGGCGG